MPKVYETGKIIAATRGAGAGIRSCSERDSKAFKYPGLWFSPGC